MKSLKRTLSLISAMALITTFSACGTSSEVVNDKDLDQATRDEIASIVAEEPLLTGELENKTIKWLGNWDINPDSTGKNVPIELAVFQERYGGKIESKIVAWSQRFDSLANGINGDEGIDFFTASDFDAFPKGIVKSMFVPVDDYIDYTSDLWKDVKDINDSLMWKGNHYIICNQVTGDNSVIIYNKDTIEEYNLEDPYELYQKNEWTWDKMEEMLLEFVDTSEERYGLDGWSFEAGISKTTGVAYVGLEDGKLVNNLRNPNLERVQQYMQDMYDKGLFLNKADFDWAEQPQFIGEGKELFYPGGLYNLYTTPEQWKATFGENVFFVPLPRDPNSEELYIPAGLDGYLMVRGGHNPEGVAKFSECKRATLLNDKTSEIANEQLFTEYNWTQEMYDMKFELDRLAQEHPVFDFYTGVSTDLTNILDSGSAGIRVSTSGEVTWAQAVEANYDAVDILIKEANDAPIE